MPKTLYFWVNIFNDYIVLMALNVIFATFRSLFVYLYKIWNIVGQHIVTTFQNVFNENLEVACKVFADLTEARLFNV